MASSEDFLHYVLDLLREVDGIEHRKMMGEYVLYCRGKVFGGIYDDRFLVKPTAAVLRLLPNAPRQLNYEGGSLMIAVDAEDPALVARVVNAMWEELPAPRTRAKRS